MKEAYWANQVDIQRQEVSAWLAFAEGDSHGAVAGMRAAADQEDQDRKKRGHTGTTRSRARTAGGTAARIEAPLGSTQGV